MDLDAAGQLLPEGSQRSKIWREWPGAGSFSHATLQSGLRPGGYRLEAQLR